MAKIALILGVIESGSVIKEQVQNVVAFHSSILGQIAPVALPMFMGKFPPFVALARNLANLATALQWAASVPTREKFALATPASQPISYSLLGVI